MTDEQRAKLDAAIGEYDYEPIVVRTLECSVDFEDQFRAGKYQIINGEHRWLRAKDREQNYVHIVPWKGISDSRAKFLLLTLNRLGGDDIKQKRAALIHGMAQEEPDYAALSMILPETEEQIRKIVEEVERGPAANPEEKARAIRSDSPMTIFVKPEHEEVIRRAIAEAMASMDEAHQHVDCEEGAALAFVCRQFLDE